MKKRDRRLITPSRTSLTVWSDKSQKGSLYNFDWKVIGQFDSKRVRLLNRNNGLMIKSLEIEENRINVCKYGTEQLGIDDAWRNS